MRIKKSLILSVFVVFSAGLLSQSWAGVTQISSDDEDLMAVMGKLVELTETSDDLRDQVLAELQYLHSRVTREDPHQMAKDLMKRIKRFDAELDEVADAVDKQTIELEAEAEEIRKDREELQQFKKSP